MSRYVYYDEAGISRGTILMDPMAGCGLVGHAGSGLKLLVAGNLSGVVFADPDAVKVFAVALHELAEEMERPAPAPHKEAPPGAEKSRSDLSAMRAALRAVKGAT